MNDQKPPVKERVLLAAIHEGLHRAAMEAFISACQNQMISDEDGMWVIVSAWPEREPGEESGKVYGRLTKLY
jgi:hypothetical protein